MPVKLIVNKGAEEQVHEYESIEQAFDSAERWVATGFIARITDKQGVVKYTQAFANGQIATYHGDATQQRPESNNQGVGSPASATQGSAHPREWTEERQERANFGRRLAGFLIDVVPITLLIAAVFYQFLGFDETLQRFLRRAADDFNARIEFISQRNQIRDLSFVVYILYCAILEGSVLQGTIGKRLVGIRVTNDQGQSLTVVRSFARNLAKFVSVLPVGLGFFWALGKRKQAWHDLIAGTLVVKKPN
jgi:uncharacterized RDD family membrane protein YckC